MYAVIYSFEVKPDYETQFIENWRKLTELIYQYEGSLGSRLHKKDNLSYIAYAQWPDYETWNSAFSNMPEHSKQISKAMKDACLSMDTIHQLEMVEDLLQTKYFND